jgi:serine/threonine-protein kinase RsbW
LDHIRVEPDRYLRPTTDLAGVVRIIEGLLEDFGNRSAGRTAFRLDAVAGSDLGLLGEVASLVDPLVGMSGLPGSERRHVRYAALEMALNAMEWGNRWERERAVRFHFELHADRFVICISDEGPGFDADAVMERESRSMDPEAQMDKRREAGRRFGGYGLRVCREFVDELHYNNSGNEVTLVKYLKTRP